MGAAPVTDAGRSGTPTARATSGAPDAANGGAASRSDAPSAGGAGGTGASPGSQATVGRPADGAGPAAIGAPPRQVDRSQDAPAGQSLALARPNPVPTPSGQVLQPRRRTLLGRTDRDVVLMMYAEGWRQKVEMNAPMERLRELKAQAHVDPLVTVGLRSDGSVESVTFNRSSGVAEIDDAIGEIVRRLGPYTPFPPDVAREYDVIEIRRVWTFDAALRLFAGGR